MTVKGSGKPAPTEAELQAILDKYYTSNDLVYYGTTNAIDLSACTGDIQLLRYTNVRDENGNYVFNNKEISVTSDNDAIKINGYKANVDVFQDNDVTVNLTVSFTREGVTVTKVFPITIKKLTQEDLDKEVEMMEYAKAHYFDGIKGDNISADQITENLHAFQEMYFDEDGKVVWVYHVDDMKNKGIIPDGYFDDPWQMEGAGYNKFKSSNNAVIQHENLVVIRPETPTEITITSWLSSERYGKYAASHKDNETLQKLFKQEVSVTVTVQPGIKAVDQLQTAITNAKELLGSVTEGNGAGQYPAGTREKLQAAIENAETIISSETATSDEMSKAAADLAKLVKEIQASQKTVEATVTAKINTVAGKGMDVSKMTVKADTAESYGYTKPESCKNKVTALDVLAAWHAATYGDKFKNDPTQYLVVSGGFISRIYGIDTYDVGILVNNKVPGSLTVDVAAMVTGDSVTFFRYGDTKTYQDLYLYFEGMPETVKVNEAINLTLYGVHPMKYVDGNPEAASVKKGFTVAALDVMGRQVATGVTDENGAVTLQINTAGTYQITVLGTAEDYHETAMIVPQETIVVTGTSDTPAAHVHSFGEWRTVSAATVFAAEQQERICACGEKETRTVGTPLKATIKVNMSTVPLKVKQATTKLKVSGLANGDAVASYTSGNKKVFTVDKNGKIKAGKKKGSAKLTITLKSGLKKTITVKVQKKTVKTKKIQGLQKTITLKKGAKTTLKPVLNPLTSQQKIKYTSSRKKVATVSSKGVIKAKKAGKTTITVKSGSKKYKITVKVK
ncbi:MAG: Ig-like domain-containing protein [Lachnospiraceae bacterium]